MKRRRRGSWQLHFACSFTSAAVKHANVGHISEALAFPALITANLRLKPEQRAFKQKKQKKIVNFKKKKEGNKRGEGRDGEKREPLESAPVFTFRLVREANEACGDERLLLALHPLCTLLLLLLLSPPFVLRCVLFWRGVVSCLYRFLQFFKSDRMNTYTRYYRHRLSLDEPRTRRLAVTAATQLKRGLQSSHTEGTTRMGP